MSSSIAAELLGIDSDKCTFEFDINLLEPIGLDLPNLNFIQPILDVLSEFILSLIGPLIKCINDCYYDGKDIINIKDFFELAGVYIDEAINLDEDIDALEQYIVEWLNKPGFGVQIKSIIGGFLGPVSESINFLCQILKFLLECLMKPILLIINPPSPENTQEVTEFINTISNFTDSDGCFNIEIPWPFPLDWFCRWVYSYIKYVFPRVCEDENDSICIDPDALDDIMDSIDGVDFELPSLGVNLSCLISALLDLGIDEQFDLSYIIMLIIELNPCYENDGSFEYGPRTPDDQGAYDDFSIDVKFMAQIFGIIIKPIILLFDSLIKPYSCFLKNFIEGFDIDLDLNFFDFIEAFFGISLEAIFNEIKAVLKAIFPDLNWNYIDGIDDWLLALDAIIDDIPWLCTIKCLVLDNFLAAIESMFSPIVDIIKFILSIPIKITETIEDTIAGGVEALKTTLESLILGLEFSDSINPIEIIFEVLLLFAGDFFEQIFILDGDNKWCLKLPEIGDCGI